MAIRARAFILDGAKVRKARELLGMEQTELARRCGIKQNTLASIEGGRRNGSVVLNAAIAQQLGVALEDISRDPEPEAAAS